MTINEIASLAGVSVSTVSKIMNGKDESISARTREHVLRIAKEYSYVPYASAIASTARTLTLGVVFCRFESLSLALPGIMKAAAAAGYSLLLRESSGSYENERKNISALISARVDGILWEPLGEESLSLKENLSRAAIPFLTAGSTAQAQFGLDFRAIGYAAAKALVDLGHERLACIAGNGFFTETFFQGVKECLFDHDLLSPQPLLFESALSVPDSSLSGREFSAVISYRYEEALKFYDLLHTLNYKSPRDISLVTLKSDCEKALPYPPISGIPVPYEDFGLALTKKLLAQIEKTEPEEEFSFPFQVDDSVSIGPPYEPGRQEILSIGSVNIDNYLNFKRLPQPGTTVVSSDSVAYAGGKCINEAIGAAKLGHNVSVIGQVGDDVDSDIIYRALKELPVDIKGLTRSKNSKTGQAYIFVQENGESMISILSGANSYMTKKQVLENEDLFARAGCCLIQTEIPMEAVMEAVHLAKKHGAFTVVKPSSAPELPEEFFPLVDLMVPNAAELDDLCPGIASLEEKAASLLSKGVGTVIVTLGADGCLICETDFSCRLPATEAVSVDHTGAGDAFISALVSYLLYGYDIKTAARIANYAAGFSVTRQGVAPSLIDRSTLEAHIRLKEPELLEKQTESLPFFCR